MPITTRVRTFFPGDKVRLELNGHSGYIHTFDGIGTIRERDGNGWMVEYPDGDRSDYFRTEHLVLVEAASFEPKFKTGDVVLADSSTLAKVHAWDDVDRRYQLIALNDSMLVEFTFTATEERIRLIGDKAIATRLKKMRG